MKNKKMLFGIIGFVAVVVIAVVLGLFLHKDKNKVTAENFKVEQGNGVFYLNGGYMILKTKDKCSYLEYESQRTYDAYTYIYNETTKALYVFVAGNVDDMKYGSNEDELLKKLEKEFSVKPVKKDDEKFKSGTWRHAKVKDHVDKGEQVCDVDAFYQFVDDRIYMVLIYNDKESKNETKLLDKLTLKDKGIVIYKNETPVKIGEDGTGYYSKKMEDTNYEMHFPQSVVENSFFQEQELYVSFSGNNGSIITCRATNEKETIEGHYKNVVGIAENATIDYNTYILDDGTSIEYEYCVHTKEENYRDYCARVQIFNGENYYVIDILETEPISDMSQYLNGYYLG